MRLNGDVMEQKLPCRQKPRDTRGTLPCMMYGSMLYTCIYNVLIADCLFDSNVPKRGHHVTVCQKRYVHHIPIVDTHMKIIMCMNHLLVKVSMTAHT